jgi:uncharacterized protein
MEDEENAPDISQRACLLSVWSDERRTDTIDLMQFNGVEIPEAALAEFCRRNDIVRLALFGSVLRDDFRPGSDIDVLVEFRAGVPVGYLRLAEIEADLSDLLGWRVDLNTEGCLSPYFRDRVLREAHPLYVAA